MAKNQHFKRRYTIELDIVSTNGFIIPAIDKTIGTIAEFYRLQLGGKQVKLIEYKAEDITNGKVNQSGDTNGQLDKRAGHATDTSRTKRG